MLTSESAPGLTRGLHSRRATAALQALTECDPALAALSLWCRHRDNDLDDGVMTAGNQINYGAGFTDLPQHLQIGLAGHHILHVALQHSARMTAMELRLGEDFDAEIWQIACDAIVNETILAAGHALPRPVMTLASLLEGSGPTLLAEWDAERLYFRLLSSTGASEGNLKAKAQAAGFRPDLSLGDETESKGDGPDKGDWQGHMARALLAGRAAGVGLGALGLRLADLPRPSVIWEHLLRRWMNNLALCKPGAAPLQPARRWLALAGESLKDGRPLPPWQSTVMAPKPQQKLLIALDASGSIPTATINRFMSEAASVARRLRVPITIAVFDTEIRSEVVLDPVQWRQTLRGLQVPQGGGTDFRPVFERAAKLACSGLIVLTDLQGPMPTRAPRFPVLWASPAKAPAPPFGRIISLGR